VPWSGTGVKNEIGKEKGLLLLDAESKERQERGLAAPVGEQEIAGIKSSSSLKTRRWNATPGPRQSTNLGCTEFWHPSPPARSPMVLTRSAQADRKEREILPLLTKGSNPSQAEGEKRTPWTAKSDQRSRAPIVQKTQELNKNSSDPEEIKTKSRRGTKEIEKIDSSIEIQQVYNRSTKVTASLPHLIIENENKILTH
jgi:hypothetical protein